MTEFREGEEVWLHPDKGKPELRHRCRITEVRRFPNNTVLYDTGSTWTPESDISESAFYPAPKEQRAKGLTAHWLAPISAVDRLGELGRTRV